MGFKDLLLRLNFKGCSVFENGKNVNKEPAKRPLWMKPITHGYHIVVEKQSFNGSRSSNDDYDSADSDSVAAHREQINDHLELWFFGVFDPRIEDRVTKYMQTHFFDIKLNESKITRKTKRAMKKAFLSAKAKMMEEDDDDQIHKVGSAAVMVINGKKLVIANLAGYKAVVCRYGKASSIRCRHLLNLSSKFNKLTTNFSCVPKYPTSDPELLVGIKKIHSDTEFVIVASSGIWEVMKSQEALSLIRHIRDPQAAAQILTREAMNRMTKHKISCLVIRFS